MVSLLMGIPARTTSLPLDFCNICSIAGPLRARAGSGRLDNPVHLCTSASMHQAMHFMGPYEKHSCLIHDHLEEIIIEHDMKSLNSRCQAQIQLKIERYNGRYTFMYNTWRNNLPMAKNT